MVAVSTLMVWAALTATGETVLLEFTAPGCTHCRSMEPTIRRLTADGFAVRQIDAQQNPDLAAQFNVRNVPTFVLLVDGQPAGGLVGAASYERLVQLYRQPTDRAAGQPNAMAPPNAPANSRPNGESPVAAPPPAPIVRGQSPTESRPNLLDAMFPGRRTAAPSSPALASPAPSSAATAPSGSPAPPARPAAMTGAPPTRTFDEHASRPPANGMQPPAPARSAPLVGSASVAGSTSTTNAQRLALQATVRIRVEDDRGHSVATGTIVDVHGNEALVLTCGHVFKEAGTKGRIKVDLFVPGAGQPIDGHLLDFDLVRDVGVIAIRPGLPVTPVRVATANVAIAKGDAVFSVGCDHGGPARVVPTQVAALNKYLGPANIVIAGAPADGRSGGGLFTTDGQLIGICNAADPADNEGLFAALPSVHWLLTHIGQERLIGGPLAAEPQSSVAAANLPNDSTPTGMSAPRDPSASHPAAPAAAAAGATAAAAASADGNEYILLIRSKTDRTRPPEAHVLDHVPTELLSRVRPMGQFSGAVPQPNAFAPAAPPSAARPPETIPSPVMRGQSPGWLPFQR